MGLADGIAWEKEFGHEQKHGEWVQSEEYEHEYYCSYCDHGIAIGAVEIYNYCPICGIKMR